MPSVEMQSILNTVFSAIGPDSCREPLPRCLWRKELILASVPQETLEKLSLMFSELVLVAALDYIDRERGQFHIS